MAAAADHERPDDALTSHAGPAARRHDGGRDGVPHAGRAGPRRRAEVGSVASTHALPLAAGNRAVALVVQRRRTRRQDRVWLRGLLRESDPVALSTALPAAATRVTGWSQGRRASLVRRLRGDVDGFEVRLSAFGLLMDRPARRLVGLLEAAQSTAALGDRLVTLFTSSVDPVLGLVVADEIPRVRLRAALQDRSGARTAIREVRRRNAGATSSAFGSIDVFLDALDREIADPDNANLRTPSAAAEARVEELLTPEEVRQERAAAAASGGPAPSFAPAGYYEDLLAAVHGVMLGFWPESARWERARAMDTSPGGHVEGIAAEAKARVDALFGSFGSAGAPSLTFGSGNLEDRTTIAGDPVDMTRWFVEDSGDELVAQVMDDHNSFEDASASQAIETRVIDHYSGVSAPSATNEVAALGALGMSTTERVRRLKVIDRMWEGVANGGNVSIRAREDRTARGTRALYWGLFKTIIHEYLHTTEHADYSRWYGRLTDHHHKITFQEGVTDLFTLLTWQSVFPDEIANNAAFRRRIQGTRDLDMAAVGGEPTPYEEIEQAKQLDGLLGTANLRAAYFRGDTDRLAGARLPR